MEVVKIGLGIKQSSKNVPVASYIHFMKNLSVNYEKNLIGLYFLNKKDKQIGRKKEKRETPQIAGLN